MKAKAMRSLAGESSCHECAPKDWRDIPNMSGDYDLDATIAHRDNPALPDKLHLYVKRASYGKRTGYSGYRGTDD